MGRGSSLSPKLLAQSQSARSIARASVGLLVLGALVWLCFRALPQLAWIAVDMRSSQPHVARPPAPEVAPVPPAAVPVPAPSPSVSVPDAPSVPRAGLPPVTLVVPPLPSALPEGPPVAPAAVPVPTPSPSASVPDAPAVAPIPDPRAPGAATIPDFPWPPPEASAQLVLPDSFFVGSRRLGDMASKLAAALDNHEYEFRFFWVPRGFAMVSRIERIDDQASSMSLPLRWSLEIYNPVYSLGSFLRGLFRAPEGYFRVIAFVVTDASFSQSEHRVTSIEALQWLRTGHNILPEHLRSQEIGPETKCTALIYEFKGNGFHKPAELTLPGHFQAKLHLEKAGIWRALEQSASR